DAPRATKNTTFNAYNSNMSTGLVRSFHNDPSSNGVYTLPLHNALTIFLTDQPTTKNVVLGTPDTFSFDLNELRTDVAVSSDIVSSDIVSSDLVSSAGLSPGSTAVPEIGRASCRERVDRGRGAGSGTGYEGAVGGRGRHMRR